MIRAPYNFVPLNEEVFFPKWAEDVSHDAPFQDAQSGVIDITITAKSPLFIRDNENKEEFCNYNGAYYIPSTSVKGMVRNVLEIMSFSKMADDTYDDDTYAVRDLNNTKLYMDNMQPQNVFCGWLLQKDGKLIVQDCGLPGRIRHEEIDKALGIDFASKFKTDGFEKTSKYKYEQLGGIHKEINVGELYKSSSNKYDKRLFCRHKPNGTQATLVVTGQPTPRKDTGKMGDGKGFEFVFFQSKGELEVEQDVFDNFKFAYFDERKTEPKESPDWTEWKKKLYAGEKVPVFFQKQGDKVKHFGLSYLYKLPYTHSVKDGIPPSHRDPQPDMAQTIFGYVDSKTKKALKGRVQFSHFKAISNIQLLPQRREVLGKPRASYYPNYVKQNGGTYKTFMDDTFEIAGRKRYPIHKSNQPTKTKESSSENMGTTFKPLKQGVIFQGKVRFHNLKKVELGALLSALTFHDTQECFHNIGLAKSLGYGKITIDLDTKIDMQTYMKEFEILMREKIEDWGNTPQLTELLSMATPQNDSILKYMDLTSFAEEKKGKNFLKTYTNLAEVKKKELQLLCSDTDMQEYNEMCKRREQEEAMKLAHEKEEQRKKQLAQEEEARKKIAEKKANKAQGLRELESCNDFKIAMQIINASLGKKAKPTPEQQEIIANFWNKHKQKAVKNQIKFFKKFNLS